MEEIVKRLHEQRRLEQAKAILESAGYSIEKIDESLNEELINNSSVVALSNEIFNYLIDILSKTDFDKIDKSFVFQLLKDKYGNDYAIEKNISSITLRDGKYHITSKVQINDNYHSFTVTTEGFVYDAKKNKYYQIMHSRNYANIDGYTGKVVKKDESKPLTKESNNLEENVDKPIFLKYGEVKNPILMKRNEIKDLSKRGYEITYFAQNSTFSDAEVQLQNIRKEHRDAKVGVNSDAYKAPFYPEDCFIYFKDSKVYNESIDDSEDPVGILESEEVNESKYIRKEFDTEQAAFDHARENGLEVAKTECDEEGKNCIAWFRSLEYKPEQAREEIPYADKVGGRDHDE